MSIKIDVSGPMLLGNVDVHVTNGQRSPEGWAAILAPKLAREILLVLDSAPQPIRDQAYAYQARIEERIRLRFANYLDMAIEEDRVFRR